MWVGYEIFEDIMLGHENKFRIIVGIRKNPQITSNIFSANKNKPKQVLHIQDLNKIFLLPCLFRWISSIISFLTSFKTVNPHEGMQCG